MNGIRRHWIHTLGLAALWVWPLHAAWATTDAALGERFDVGGYRLHMACQGRGRPAVIMDAGLGGSSKDWRYVQRDLRQRTTACVYDRAGYGHSDEGPKPRSSAQIVSELRSLLQEARISPPWVLVGHSFGGYNMRLFASRYPRDVAGVVLVDAPHEGQIDHFLDSKYLRQMDTDGMLRRLWDSDMLGKALDQLGPLASLFGIEDRTATTVFDELAAYRQSSANLREADLPRDLPIIVIMHGRPFFPGGSVGEDMEQDWLKLQRDLAARHPRSRFIIAKKSDHNVEFQQPELISDAVKDLLDSRFSPSTPSDASRPQQR
jgi:pimeloyl-ACP methyl ester carboxylesterase